MNRCACPNPSLSKARLQPATRFHHPPTHLIQNPQVISQKFLNLDLFNQGESTCKLINLNICFFYKIQTNLYCRVFSQDLRTHRFDNSSAFSGAPPFHHKKKTSENFTPTKTPRVPKPQLTSCCKKMWQIHPFFHHLLIPGFRGYQLT